MYFDRATFGADRLIRYPLIDYTRFLPLAENKLPVQHAVADMPLSAPARTQLLYLLTSRENFRPDLNPAQQENYLWQISYRDFLERHMGVTEPEVFALLQGLTADATASMERSSALGLLGYNGFPGLQATALADYNRGFEPYIFHFPDGNAAIARLLVRRLIPEVAPGSTMDDIVLAPFDYALLDQPGSDVRLRLNATVVHAANEPGGEGVSIQYVSGGSTYQAHGRHCVMAEIGRAHV